jgi:hypothetical protein
MDEQPKNMKAVYTIVERGEGKSHWIRVGTGFTNRDGSLSLRLDAMPVNGRLQVRDWDPADRRPESVDGPQPAPRSRSREPALTPVV